MTQDNMNTLEKTVTLQENLPSTETMMPDSSTDVDISDQEYLETAIWQF